jgi:MFS family permease
VLAHFAHHLVTALPVPLLPLIRDDFALDYTQSALVISAFAIPYGIAQLPAGWLADRMAPRLLIAVGISGVAVAGLLVGLSQSYVMLVLCLVLMGLVGGGYHPAAPPLISAVVEPENRGRALGLHTIGGGASYFLAPLAAAGIAAVWGWRSPFIGLAIPAMAFGVVFYMVLGRRVGAGKTDGGMDGGRGEVSKSGGRWRKLVPFLVLSTFTQAVILSVVTMIPLYMVDHFRVAEEKAGALIALVYSSGLWAGPIGGHLSDRLGRITVIVAVCLIAGPVIYLLSMVPHLWAISALLVALGIVIYVRMPVSEAYIVGSTSQRHRSMVLGIYYFSTMEGSGVLTPVVGNLVDRFGFHTAFTMAAAAVVVVTLVCSIWLWGKGD